jgi:hypothetical protein
VIVTYVEFTRPTLVPAASGTPVRYLSAGVSSLAPLAAPTPCPPMRLADGCVVIGNRRYPLSTAVHAYELA